VGALNFYGYLAATICHLTFGDEWPIIETYKRFSMLATHTVHSSKTVESPFLETVWHGFCTFGLTMVGRKTTRPLKPLAEAGRDYVCLSEKETEVVRQALDPSSPVGKRRRNSPPRASQSVR
jgi:hypothetical protein